MKVFETLGKHSTGRGWGGQTTPPCGEGISPQTDLESAVPIKSQLTVYAETENLVLNFIWKCKGSRVAKAKSEDFHASISKLAANQK